MNDKEHRYIQNELSKLLDSKKIHQKYSHSGYTEAYRKAILDCKSRIHNFYNYHSKKMTNFEELKNGLQRSDLTPEDLADFRYEYIGFGCDNCECKKTCFDDEEFHCKEMFLKWLKNEVEE
jgi:hypothetical protein